MKVVLVPVVAEDADAHPGEAKSVPQLHGAAVDLAKVFRDQGQGTQLRFECLKEGSAWSLRPGASSCVFLSRIDGPES